MNKEFLEGLGLSAQAAEQVIAAHEASLQELKLHQQVELAVQAAGARNAVAARALLDMDALRAGGDVETAVRQLKQEHPYLFHIPGAPYAPFPGGPEEDRGAPLTLADALRDRYDLHG